MGIAALHANFEENGNYSKHDWIRTINKASKSQKTLNKHGIKIEDSFKLGRVDVITTQCNQFEMLKWIEIKVLPKEIDWKKNVNYTVLCM